MRHAFGRFLAGAFASIVAVTACCAQDITVFESIVSSDGKHALLPHVPKLDVSSCDTLEVQIDASSNVQGQSGSVIWNHDRKAPIHWMLTPSTFTIHDVDGNAVECTWRMKGTEDNKGCHGLVGFKPRKTARFGRHGVHDVRHAALAMTKTFNIKELIHRGTSETYQLTPYQRTWVLADCDHEGVDVDPEIEQHNYFLSGVLWEHGPATTTSQHWQAEPTEKNDTCHSITSNEHYVGDVHYLSSFELDDTRLDFLLRLIGRRWTTAPAPDLGCSQDPPCGPCGVSRVLDDGGVVTLLESPVLVTPGCVRQAHQDEHGNVDGAGQAAAFVDGSCDDGARGSTQYFAFSAIGEGLAPRCSGRMDTEGSEWVQTRIRPGQSDWIVVSRAGLHEARTGEDGYLEFKRDGHR